MTEKSAADGSAPSAEPVDEVGDPAPSVGPAYAERYGVKRGMSRARKISLGVIGFLLLCGVAAYIGWNQANPQIQGTVISYKVSGQSMIVTFEVDKSADQAVECTLQAEDTQGAVIGSTEVNVPSGRAKEDMVATVNTTGTPNTALVSSCTAAS